jgi:hypothetical protein
VGCGSLNLVIKATSTGATCSQIFDDGTNVGIGTVVPAVKVEISSAATDLLKLTSTTGTTGNHAYVAFNTYSGTGVGARIGAVDMGGYNASLVFEVNNFGTSNSTSTTEAMRITNAGPFIAGTYITGANYEQVLDPQSTSDNVYHTLTNSNGFGLTTVNIVATSSQQRLDGNIRILGSYLGGILTTNSAWYGNAGTTTQGSCTNCLAVSADNQFHWAYCPDNYIATGIEIQATGNALDGCLKLRCTQLNSAYSTTDNYNNSGLGAGGYNSSVGGPATGNNVANFANLSGMESPFTTPWSIQQDNAYHLAWCPQGMFVRGIRIWASSDLDGAMTVFCTGIKAN